MLVHAWKHNYINEVLSPPVLLELRAFLLEPRTEVSVLSPFSPNIIKYFLTSIRPRVATLPFRIVVSKSFLIHLMN